jgi:hypothetical protein
VALKHTTCLTPPCHPVVQVGRDSGAQQFLAELDDHHKVRPSGWAASHVTRSAVVLSAAETAAVLSLVNMPQRLQRLLPTQGPEILDRWIGLVVP